MNILKKLTLLLAILLIVSGSDCLAQGANRGSSDTEKALKTFINQFAAAYSNLPKSKNKADVLKYFDREATSTRFVFNIKGQAAVTTGNFAKFEGYLNHIIRANGIELHYNVSDIAVTYLDAEIATLAYKVNYETKEENGIWVKGLETVTMALEKSGSSWKIVHWNMMQVEDEKLKGTCLCELYLSEADDGEVVAKTTIPSGKTYTTRFDNFVFRTSGSGKVIRVGNYVYKHKPSGPLYVIQDGEEIEIAIAKSKKEIVLAIIEHSLYADSCARLKTTSNE
ncbi:nuclear transport factor 2 family protein [Pontibacter sp. G13]|uniref:nuclear transport factor 2 family protein n=1 Tax=Pontibacter sp. G13 TaxID=3074898 RepID=UPI00288AC68F|nr:nuclear transport factor 2 family protein [Pontibacter sp. G13]WNJ20839.1 nuclear transport factor 2 family protein [Pontibacter sp. G13]